MCKTIVFLETSLSHDEARLILPDAVYMLSVKKGDVIRAIKNGFERIIIIDGNFGWTPSVWHKEILIALDYGIEVFGAASMGAIRAAELDMYGMQGIGRVYSLYKSGMVDGDDEVAIAFSRDNDLQTVPLINIRATFEELNFENMESAFATIRAIFYADRTWNTIAKLIPQQICELIQSNYIDVKKEDTISLLTHIRGLPSQNKSYIVYNRRQFTIFEKNLIESVFNPVILNTIKAKQRGDYGQLVRAKNLVKLLGTSKNKKNLRYYQSLVCLIDEQKYIIGETAFIDQLNIFREEKNLLSGHDFKMWLINKKLYHSNLEQIFSDYLKIQKLVSITYDYNNYLDRSI